MSYKKRQQSQGGKSEENLRWGRFPRWLTEKGWPKHITPAGLAVVAWFVSHADFDEMVREMKPGKVAKDIGYKPCIVHRVIKKLLRYGILRNTGKRWVYSLNIHEPKTDFPTNDKEGLMRTTTEKDPHTNTLRHRHNGRTDEKDCTPVPKRLYASTEPDCTPVPKLNCTPVPKLDPDIIEF